MPHVSIVVSTYNRKERLSRALDSVASQTYQDWECLVVDDGSNDGTAETVRDFAARDPRFRYHKIPHFGNDTRPKNAGITAAKGEYVALLDDDNEYLPDHLMILVNAAEKHPDVTVLYGDRMIVSDDDPDFTPQVGTHSDFRSDILFAQNFIDTSDVLVKREALFLVGGFDERYRKYVDWNLWVRLTKANQTFLRVPQVITRYHLHKQQKSVTVTDKLPVGRLPIGDQTPENIFKPEWDPFELEIQLPYLGAIRQPKVAIFTLTKDRLDYTKRMEASLRKAGYPFDWFVVDQGSTDGTKEWLKTTRAHVIDNPDNKGISIGSNQALAAIGEEYDFIIKIDNDCELESDDWLVRLLYIAQAHWTLVLSPRIEGLIDNPGGAPRLAYKTLRKHFLGITGHLGGIFVMAHKSAYQNFRWDAGDTLHSLQDVVFSQHVQALGYVLAYVEDLRAVHIDTSAGQKAKYPAYFALRAKERVTSYEKAQ